MFSVSVLAQSGRAAPEPQQLIIAESSFWDFGSAMNSYDLYIVRSIPIGISIARISITPAGWVCNARPEVRSKSKAMRLTMASLLSPINPCAIPKKKFSREVKRPGNMPIFSGAHILMQAQCGSFNRIFTSNILDRDMFDQHPNTPRYTSWTMMLLGKIESGLGPGPMDRPIFSVPGIHAPRHMPMIYTPILRDIGIGKYDSLFRPDKISNLYHQAIQPPPPPPQVKLISSIPSMPIVFVKPQYPPIAVMARVEGIVRIKIAVERDGHTGKIFFESGPHMMQGTVAQAVRGWKFGKSALDHKVEVEISFKLHCTNPS